MSLNASPARMVAPAAVTSTAHAVTADGFLTDAEYTAAKDASGVLHLGVPDGFRRRGGLLRPLVDADEDDTAELKLWRVTPADTRSGVYAELLATVTVTAGSAAVTAGDLEDSGVAYKTCDTVVVDSTTGLADALAAAYGASISAHSPADNTQGHLLIPDAYGAMDLLVTAAVTSGDGFNALAEAVT